jgi:hypothetical protein
MGTTESCKKSWITRKKKYGSSGVADLSDFKTKSSLGHMGQVPWNKGTKGLQVAWNKGLKSAYPIWNKGLTKETDERVLNVALKKVGRKKPPISEETRKKLSEAGKGRVMSEYTKERLYLSRKGSHHTDEAKQTIGLKNSISWATKTESEKIAINQKNRESHMGRKSTDVTIAKLQIAAKEQWRTMRDQMILSLQNIRDVKPNKFELKFLKMCEENKIDKIKYVGNGTFWISVPSEFRHLKLAINPDYVIEPFSKNRAIIETIGLHWHNVEDIALRKNIYEKLGIKYLFVTDKQFKENFSDVVDDVRRFVEGVTK